MKRLAKTTGRSAPWIAPGLVGVGFGCLLFIAGWVLLMNGVGLYLLLPGLILCALGGWLLRGWRGAMLAPLFALVLGIVLLVATNAIAAALSELTDSGSSAIQTPSPKKG